VILAMDHIDERLTTFSFNTKYTMAIRSAVRIGQKTLNHYYSLTDSSDVYRIAMVLHPRHKLSYFKTARWPAEWIMIAEELVQDEFEQSYMMETRMQDSDAEIIDNDNKEKSTNIFDSLPSLAPPKVVDLSSELDRYLKTDVEHVADAVAWWDERQAMYPHL
ncbi:hypothetical protein SCLCIDRAFT_43263, partial [Scleroderma citrinum Foug A]